MLAHHRPPRAVGTRQAFAWSAMAWEPRPRARSRRDAVPDPLRDGAGLPTRTPSDLTSRTLPDAPAAPVLHTGLLHEGSTKGDQPRKPPLGFFLAAVHTAKPGSALSPPSRARRRLVQPPHTPHTLQVWLRTSAVRHETERQKRARFSRSATTGSPARSSISPEIVLLVAILSASATWAPSGTTPSTRIFRFRVHRPNRCPTPLGFLPGTPWEDGGDQGGCRYLQRRRARDRGGQSGNVDWRVLSAPCVDPKDVGSAQLTVGNDLCIRSVGDLAIAKVCPRSTRRACPPALPHRLPVPLLRLGERHRRRPPGLGALLQLRAAPRRTTTNGDSRRPVHLNSVLVSLASKCDPGGLDRPIVHIERDPLDCEHWIPRRASKQHGVHLARQSRRYCLDRPMQGDPHRWVLQETVEGASLEPPPLQERIMRAQDFPGDPRV